MNAKNYRERIESLVQSTDNEQLLRHWVKQLEWDIEHQDEISLSEEEWNMVQEGIAEYEQGETISFEEFIGKRK